MPITSSAKKALRQNIKRRVKNLARKEAYKKAIKDARKLFAAGKLNEARGALPKVFKALDKAAKTHVINWGRANRLKSRVSRSLNKLK